MTQREDFEEAVAMKVAGYLVWDEKYETAYRGRLYSTLPDAQTVLGGIVWHSRNRYAIRAVLLSDNSLSYSTP